MQDENPKIDEQDPVVEPVVEQSAEQVSEVPVDVPAPTPESIPDPEPISESLPITEPTPVAETPPTPEPEPTLPVAPTPPPVVSDVLEALTPEPVATETEKPVIATPQEPEVAPPPTPQPEPARDPGGIPQKVLDLTPAELDAAHRLWATRNIRSVQAMSTRVRRERRDALLDDIQKYITSNAPVTLSMISYHANISPVKATNYMRILIHSGRVKAKGHTNNRQYY